MICEFSRVTILLSWFWNVTYRNYLILSVNEKLMNRSKDRISTENCLWSFVWKINIIVTFAAKLYVELCNENLLAIYIDVPLVLRVLWLKILTLDTGMARFVGHVWKEKKGLVLVKLVTKYMYVHAINYLQSSLHNAFTITTMKTRIFHHSNFRNVYAAFPASYRITF